jgi:hypothetical protein
MTQVDGSSAKPGELQLHHAKLLAEDVGWEMAATKEMNFKHRSTPEEAYES